MSKLTNLSRYKGKNPARVREQDYRSSAYAK